MTSLQEKEKETKRKMTGNETSNPYLHYVLIILRFRSLCVFDVEQDQRYKERGLFFTGFRKKQSVITSRDISRLLIGERSKKSMKWKVVNWGEFQDLDFGIKIYRVWSTYHTSQLWRDSLPSSKDLANHFLPREFSVRNQ